MNGTTTNGRISYPGAGSVLKKGQAGSSKPSTPQASQVAAMGASDPGTGRKHEPGVVRVKPHGNDGESRAMLAQSMYPSSKGSRFA